MARFIATILAIALGVASSAFAAASHYVARPAAPFLFTPRDERAAAFSPDGNTVVYTLRLGEYRQVLVVIERHHGHWGKPYVPSFSGVANDATPSFSPDGSELLFASNRAGSAGTKGDYDIWTVSRTARGWGSAQPLRGDVNTSANESAPMLTRSGKLYFASSRSGNGDIYVANRGPEGFTNARSVGPGINSEYPETSVAVSPSERLLVFSSTGRPDQQVAPGHPYARPDLYVSHWTAKGWGPARRLGSAINTQAGEGSPYFSADGRLFYFMSEHGFATDQQVLLTAKTLFRGLASPLNALGNIYVIDARALEEAR